MKSKLPALALVAGLALAFVAAASTGCAGSGDADKAGGAQFTPGKADGAFEISELGPLADASRVTLADGRVPAFRVESYGGTRLSLALAGGDEADAYLVVEGPLDGDGDDTAPGAGKLLAQDDDSGPGFDAALEVTLEQPGVYRVIAGSYDTLALGAAPAGERLTVEARCLAGCARATIAAEEFLQELRASGGLEALRAMLLQRLAATIPDEGARAALAARLDALLASQSFAGLERFPALPLSQFATMRPALGLSDAPPPAPLERVDGELSELLGRCVADRSPPPPIAQLPGVGYGHFPDRALTACQVARSEALARVLTALAAGNGSVVRYAGRELSTPAALIDALIETGHAVEVRNERTYANFISLTWRGRDVVWPTWIDTGITLPSGERLVVPSGHSHHAWRISGPVVDARVMFYLGISGAGFFAQTSTRPAWTGQHVSEARSSDDAGGRARILATLDAASTYLRRVLVERETVAAGLPADGYGVLGICNDSNAAIELATAGTITTFPLLRAAWLDAEAPLGDGLDPVLRGLPHDGDVAPTLADLPRILAMQPTSPGSLTETDAVLARQLAEASSL